MATTKGPAMVKFSQVKTMELPEVTNNQGAKAWMKTILHSNVPGKQMQAGVFQLDPGSPFTYTYCYEGVVLVINGQFTATHVGKETYNLNVSDTMYIQAGTKIEYSTNTLNSRFYFVIQPPQAEECARVHAGLAENPAPTVITGLPTVEDTPPLPNDFKANAYLKDMHSSTVAGKEMTSGVYRCLKGPYHDYFYDYEEFKYIFEGQLNLKDGTGQHVEVKAGDLMHFPDGTFVNFGTPENGMGFFVGQRVGGSA